jgi:hypothetical protein
MVGCAEWSEMETTMRLILLLTFFLITVTPPLTSQTYFEQSEARVQNSPISYEAVALFDSDSATIRLNIHYRIAQSFFIFVRNETATQTAAYSARGELLVDPPVATHPYNAPQ